MADRARKALFPNPFYVILLVSSTVFTVTVLAYLIGPSIEQRALDPSVAGRPGSGSLAMAAWLDRKGPLILAVEFAGMLVSRLLAIPTHRWFPSQPPRKPPTTE